MQQTRSTIIEKTKIYRNHRNICLKSLAVSENEELSYRWLVAGSQVNSTRNITDYEGNKLLKRNATPRHPTHVSSNQSHIFSTLRNI